MILHCFLLRLVRLNLVIYLQFKATAVDPLTQPVVSKRTYFDEHRLLTATTGSLLLAVTPAGAITLTDKPVHRTSFSKLAL